MQGAVSKIFFRPFGGGGRAKEPGLSPGSATGLKVFKSYTVSSKLFLEKDKPNKIKSVFLFLISVWRHFLTFAMFREMPCIRFMSGRKDSSEGSNLSPLLSYCFIYLIKFV